MNIFSKFQFLMPLCAMVGGYAADHLVLDLDASKGVKSNADGRVESWTNQATDFPAKDFLPNDLGREVPGSGMPTLLQVDETRSFPVISFGTPGGLGQELINADEDAFDYLIKGSGHTWYMVVSIYEQHKKSKEMPSAIFGNLRNTNAYKKTGTGGQYEGFWSVISFDYTVFAGVRNGVDFTRNGINNPQINSKTRLEQKRFYLIAGRMGAGTGKVPLAIFINKPVAENVGEATVNLSANPSKMAIGQERDATNHPGVESANCAIARLLIYDQAHDDAMMATIMSDLKQRYVINTDVP